MFMTVHPICTRESTRASSEEYTAGSSPRTGRSLFWVNRTRRIRRPATSWSYPTSVQTRDRLRWGTTALGQRRGRDELAAASSIRRKPLAIRPSIRKTRPSAKSGATDCYLRGFGRLGPAHLWGRKGRKLYRPAGSERRGVAK